jgi:hypothetical protein
MKISYLITIIGVLSLISISSCTQPNGLQKGESINESKFSNHHQSNLPPLQLGSRSDVENMLNSLYRKGGISSVVQWAEKELQPGRKVFISGYYTSDGLRASARIENRSVWLIDNKGKLLKSFLSPLNVDKPESLFFVNWYVEGKEVKEPFNLRLELFDVNKVP